MASSLHESMTYDFYLFLTLETTKETTSPTKAIIPKITPREPIVNSGCESFSGIDAKIPPIVSKDTVSPSNIF